MGRKRILSWLVVVAIVSLIFILGLSFVSLVVWVREQPLRVIASKPNADVTAFCGCRKYRLVYNTDTDEMIWVEYWDLQGIKHFLRPGLPGWATWLTRYEILRAIEDLLRQPQPKKPEPSVLPPRLLYF